MWRAWTKRSSTYGRPTTPFLQSPLDFEERNYSERTAETIDSESRRILDETYRRVKQILLERREPLRRISQELIRKETLNRTELDSLLRSHAPGVWKDKEAGAVVSGSV